MKIDYVYVNPGGNPTALVLTRIRRVKQAYIAKKIIQQIPTCEQVGFIESAQNPRAECRLQMMGGEFCGNALRALAAWLALKRKIPQKKNYKFKVESSGVKGLVSTSVCINFRKNIIYSEINVAVQKNILIYKQVIFLNRQLVSVIILNFEGTFFILVPQKYQNNKTDFRLLFKDLYKQMKLRAKACGLIYYRRLSSQKFSIIPIIYVRGTGTIIRETSCASGSLALVMAKKLRSATIAQPSGCLLKIRIFKKGIYVGGEIVSVDKKILNV